MVPSTRSTTAHPVFSNMIQERLDLLFYYMNERHWIYQRKTKGLPKPWTDDVILQQYSFTNVFRELDKTTKWIDQNILKPYQNHPNLWFISILARQISWPDTIQELKDHDQLPLDDKWDFRQAAAVIDGRVVRGDKAWTGAFMVRAESDPKQTWYDWTKAEYVLGVVLGNMWFQRNTLQTFFESQPTIQAAVELLSQYYGVGPFMAKEFVNDLLMTRYMMNPEDALTWCAAGPGAIRGLNYIHGRDINASISQDQAREEIRAIAGIANGPDSPLGEHIRNVESPLTLERFQFSLCELMKYAKVKHGWGRPRSKYPGR